MLRSHLTVSISFFRFFFRAVRYLAEMVSVDGRPCLEACSQGKSDEYNGKGHKS